MIPFIKHDTIIPLLLYALTQVMEQGKGSIGISFSSGYVPCNYHGLEHTKCPIGHMIDDIYYDKSFEQHPCYNLMVMQAIQKSCGRVLDDDEIGFLIHMQNCHDDIAEECYINGGEFNELLQQRICKAVAAGELPRELLEVFNES